eukprot:6442692-Ditylum_brightwellii.AAC.1
MGYRSGMEGIMKNRDVVKKKELKCSRTHKCSAYCLQKKKTKKKKVKMDFGEELKYDLSGGNDGTRGKPCPLRGEISLIRMACLDTMQSIIIQRFFSNHTISSGGD